MSKWHKVQTLDDWPEEAGEYLAKTWDPDTRGGYIERIQVALYEGKEKGWYSHRIVVSWTPIPGDEEEEQ